MMDEPALSPRDLEIARLAAASFTDQEIAGRLFITRNTVNTHLKRAYRALGVHNRAQLAHALGGRENYPNG